MSITSNRIPIVIGCYQLSDLDIEAPILAPDIQQCPQRGSRYLYHYKSNEEAKLAYKYVMNKNKKHRKYLFGSRYSNIYMNKAQIIDVREYDGAVDLNIELFDGRSTILKIRDVSMMNESMDVMYNFIQKSNKDSQARCDSGDMGVMYAYGYHNAKYGDYISMKDKNSPTREYCIEMRRLLDYYFSNEIKDIINADRQQGKIPSMNMGGKYGISSYCLVSKDLVNSAHYDLDTSMGISVFREEIESKAVGWYFVLPNTSMKSSKKATIIKLFNGCAISWAGREIFHCTGLKDLGDNNHVYGCYFGGKKYT